MPPRWNERNMNIIWGFLSFRKLVYLLSLLSVSSASMKDTNNFEPQENKFAQIKDHIHPESESIIPPRQEPTSKACTTPGCIREASEIIDKLNVNVHPCDDFYDFVCGGYKKKTNIQSGIYYTDVYSDLQEKVNKEIKSVLEDEVRVCDSPATVKAKNFYKSCMNSNDNDTTDLQNLQLILNQLGGWPLVVGDEWNETNFSWFKTIKICRKLGLPTNFLFNIEVNDDITNSSKRIITFVKPNDLTTPIKNAEFSERFNTSVDTAIILGADPAFVYTEMLDVLNFHREISTIEEQTINEESHENPMTLQTLSNLSDFSWVDYLNSLLPENIQINENEEIFVYSLEYFEHMPKLLNKTNNRVIGNFLMWKITTYLSDQFKEIKNIQDSSSRWLICLQNVTKNLQYAVGSVYVQKFINDDTKDEVLKIYTSVMEAFKKSLRLSDWMDKISKENTLSKANSIIMLMEYPKEFMEDEVVTKYYDKLRIESENYLTNIRRIKIFEAYKNFETLRELIHSVDWRDYYDVFTVNALYCPRKNCIKIPAAILQNPFYDNDRPNYLNFGAIGSIIGHEIIHAFGSKDIIYENEGRILTEETRKVFEKRANCFVYQYGNFSYDQVDGNVNGSSSLSDNISDNGGIKSAYQAYQSWTKINGLEDKLPGLDYTPNQLFWISAGQHACESFSSGNYPDLNKDHAPNRFRVIGPLSNSFEFARDWQCAPGTKMNPENKCLLW